jgi:calcium/calmodulin-dependent protein kinase I
MIINLLFVIRNSKDDYNFVIADFGLGGILVDEESCRIQCGSAGFIAPEIFDGVPYNCKVDVFSAGVLLYVLYFHLLLY